jgi:hypothetical protein
MGPFRIRATAAASGLLLVLGLGLTGCTAGGAGTGASAHGPVLAGEWTQTGSASMAAYQRATIDGDAIRVDWVLDGGRTTALYWAGTFEAPDGDGASTWVSKNDTDKTDMSRLASPDTTKSFTYERGEIRYTVAYMGVTTTVHLRRK